jgi:hypothetical protein
MGINILGHKTEKNLKQIKFNRLFWDQGTEILKQGTKNRIYHTGHNTSH